MGLQREQIESMHEKAETAFYRKVLDHPFDLTKDDYQHVAETVHEIIRVATTEFEMSYDETMKKLQYVREHAAHDHVTIDLDYEPDTVINEGLSKGLLRTMARGRENT